MPVIDRYVGITMNTSLAAPAHESLSPSVVVISVHGEIDASNAGILSEQVAEHTTQYRGLILDLAGLEFIGTEGFSALHRIAVSCARTGIGWAVVPSAAVSRLLQICDPQGSLPAVANVGAALSTFPGRPPTSTAAIACADKPVAETAVRVLNMFHRNDFRRQRC